MPTLPPVKKGGKTPPKTPEDAAREREEKVAAVAAEAEAAKQRVDAIMVKDLRASNKGQMGHYINSKLSFPPQAKSRQWIEHKFQYKEPPGHQHAVSRHYGKKLEKPFSKQFCTELERTLGKDAFATLKEGVGLKERKDYDLSNLKMAMGLGKWKAKAKVNQPKSKHGPTLEERLANMASSKRAAKLHCPSIFAAVWDKGINETPRRNETYKAARECRSLRIKNQPLPRHQSIKTLDSWFNEYGEPKGLSLKSDSEPGQLAEGGPLEASHSMPSLYGGRSTGRLSPGLGEMESPMMKKVAGSLPRGRWTPEPGLLPPGGPNVGKWH